MNHSGLMEGYAGFFGGNGAHTRLNLVSQGSRLDVARPTNSGTICWRAWAAMPRDAEGSSWTTREGIVLNETEQGLDRPPSVASRRVDRRVRRRRSLVSD